MNDKNVISWDAHGILVSIAMAVGLLDTVYAGSPIKLSATTADQLQWGPSLEKVLKVLFD